MTSAAPLRPRDFKLVRRIGSGDIIGMVYLCHLRSSPASEAERESPCLYTMKVVDRRRWRGSRS
jgi:hypothetical protein